MENLEALVLTSISGGVGLLVWILKGKHVKATTDTSIKAERVQQNQLDEMSKLQAQMTEMREEQTKMQKQREDDLLREIARHEEEKIELKRQIKSLQVAYFHLEQHLVENGIPIPPLRDMET